MKKISNSPSQANQDSFVMNMLGFKKNGYYLEVGASDYYELSNTYILENDYGWSGISLEIDTELSNKFNLLRKNKCLNIDAITTDYLSMLSEENAPKHIDYLQLDIDPAPNTLAALKSIPLENYTFSVITFEHDVYSEPENHNVQIEAYEILSSYGYKRVIKNLMNNGIPFEDWYINPSVIDDSVWGPIVNENVSAQNIFRVI